jgi:hypothetical protein
MTSPDSERLTALAAGEFGVERPCKLAKPPNQALIANTRNISEHNDHTQDLTSHFSDE